MNIKSINTSQSTKRTQISQTSNPSETSNTLETTDTSEKYNSSETSNIDNVDQKKLDIENIILNLKMISRINKNDKLYFHNNLFKIDSPNISRGIIRWVNDYTRDKTMAEIDLLAINTQQYITFIFKKEIQSDEDNRICQNILSEINTVIPGLQNLKITYNDDPSIQSKLDVIQEKFNVCKTEISKHLRVGS